MSEQQKKVYLMLGGTFLPAFVGVIGYASIKKEFAGLSAVSGYLTSKMIN